MIRAAASDRQKLVPYRALVRELYVGKHLIGTRILRELRAAGYDGSLTILYDYLRTLREPRLAAPLNRTSWNCCRRQRKVFDSAKARDYCMSSTVE